MFYLDLLGALERHQVRYVLVGGLALNLHGVERATMDIDLALALDAGNLHRFILAARELKLSPVAPVSLEDLANEDKRKDWIESKHMVAFGLRAPEPGTPMIDALIVETLPFEQLQKHCESRAIGTTRVSVASIDDLIEMKRLSARMQDLADIRALEKLKQME